MVKFANIKILKIYPPGQYTWYVYRSWVRRIDYDPVPTVVAMLGSIELNVFSGATMLKSYCTVGNWGTLGSHCLNCQPVRCNNAAAG